MEAQFVSKGSLQTAADSCCASWSAWFANSARGMGRLG
jgi:hypothetical protein